MKKVLLLNGCLEPGKDGVGDYSLLFAAELQNLGLEVLLCSLHDSFIKKVSQKYSNGLNITRIPATLSWHKKTKLLESLIDACKPDHISLQFVIYAFHTKGLPFRAMYYLQKVLKRFSSVSLMMHEPWIGRSYQEPAKRRVIGFIQRNMIKKFIAEVSPKVIHTSNSAFHKLLAYYKIDVKILPLFSNIPYIPHARLQVEAWMLANDCIGVGEQLRIGIFGRIPQQWNLKGLLEWLSKENENAVLLHIGKADEDQVRKLSDEINSTIPSLKAYFLGERDTDFVSGFLQTIDAGVAVTATQILGKSGVAAAYREHGLPIIIAGLDENFRKINLETILQDDCISLNHSLDSQRLKLRRREATNTRCQVARQWVQDVQTTKVLI
ncbi:glycosyltransferase family 4 protein [Pontibacter sp. SGAir0037]|uniref:glycosyltransferase family 4 protein n=1 Tax=Pontibacter sp. SGAir0037 TaxID=2571030 RepID=UPI0010CCD605|nr:glycosyltransferase family 4 protein [Pontibacter sp. SGAir0037]QCR22600.1 hypothetical protein C1N53_09790 [Pontibacter sp. SGAir0037]